MITEILAFYDITERLAFYLKNYFVLFQFQHNPSPLRLARSLSVGCQEQSKDDIFKSFGKLILLNLRY